MIKHGDVDALGLMPWHRHPYVLAEEIDPSATRRVPVGDGGMRRAGARRRYHTLSILSTPI